MAGTKARVKQVKNLLSPYRSPQLYGLRGPRFSKGWVTQTSFQKTG
jgi:flagellar biosynthesis/type III secretory pathway chaperone